MKLTDTELHDLKKRCIDAMATNAVIAHYPSYMLRLIEEVEAGRKSETGQGIAVVSKPAPVVATPPPPPPAPVEVPPAVEDPVAPLPTEETAPEEASPEVPPHEAPTVEIKKPGAPSKKKTWSA